MVDNIETAFWLALLGAFCLLFGLAGLVWEKFFLPKVVDKSANDELFLRLNMGDETVSLFYVEEGKDILMAQLPREFKGTAVFYKEYLSDLVESNRH